MKKIEAVIQPDKLEKVKSELDKIQVSRLTVLSAEGYGRQKGHKEIFRGVEYNVNFVQKIYLVVVVSDEMAQQTVDAIIRAARREDGGKIGDGKIFISTLEEVVRIRTGETGNDAI
jgi:nitrogen regulatory protein P-II 1